MADRVELLQGTLDMLILRTLRPGPAHGHGIAKHIQQTSDDALQVEHGSLYPALHRLERKGWIASNWELSKTHNRELKFYRLTPAAETTCVRRVEVGTPWYMRSAGSCGRRRSHR